MHNTCIKHGRDIKTQYIGSTSILLLRKDCSFIRLDRTQLFFRKHIQLIVVQKLLGWKLEKSYTKKYACHLGFHQRSPWNTSGKANWVVQLSRSFPSNQPILNPICERTERPVIRDDARTVPDGRKTSRSQEIDVNSFHEEAVSSERTGRPVTETSVIQTRSSEDSKDPHVETAHERTRRLVVETNTENVPDSCQTRSVHESETFNVGDKTIRERTGRPVMDHDNLSHEKIMVNEAHFDFRIPGQPHSVVKHAQSTSVREMIQKNENHPDRHALQQDLRQNQAEHP